jgi:hypothetical protein
MLGRICALQLATVHGSGQFHTSSPFDVAWPSTPRLIFGVHSDEQHLAEGPHFSWQIVVTFSLSCDTKG